MIRRNQHCIKRITAVSNATPGARTNIPHLIKNLPSGIGPAWQHIDVFCQSADDDVSSVPSAAVCGTDDVNIRVKCNMPSITLVIAIWRNKDDVGRPANE